MAVNTPEITTYLQRLELREPQKPGLQVIENELALIFSQSTGVIRKMCDYLLQSSGKRIRPLMVLYSGLIFSEITRELIRTAAACELIHMASLVHDDIIDDAEFRRHQPSVHQVWSPQYAVLCGDYLFTKAFDTLAESPGMGSIVHLMANTVQCMSDGELRQAEDLYCPHIGIERYYERVSLKTAIFIQNVCKSGAIIAGAHPRHVNLLGDFGLHFGLAFQISDDVMDFCGESIRMGKPKREDLVKGNVTLPVILLLQHPEYGAWVSDVINKRELSDVNLSRIEDLMKETGIFNKSLNYAVLHMKWAKNCLAQLPQTTYTSFLESLVNKLQSGFHQGH